MDSNDSAPFGLPSSSGSIPLNAPSARFDDSEDLNAIVTTLGVRVPYIFPAKLTTDKFLGKGTCFEVTRELFDSPNENSPPYFVAVKRIVPAPAAPLWEQQEHRRRRNNGVARELQTLIKLRSVNTSVILSILGYGFGRTSSGLRPYIVVDYSDHGTLIEYLQRVKTTMIERRDLALDVAVGLGVLHENNIAHGDLKLSNVLVFDSSEVVSVDRPLIAKLADFGATIQEDNTSQPGRYTGTPLYNPPEQEHRGSFKHSDWHRQEDFYCADIWSLGLATWEIMQRGQGYLQPAWLAERQSKLDFLDMVASSEVDGILSRAKQSFESLVNPHQESSAAGAVLKTFDLTLRDDPHKRSSISEVVRALAQGTRADRPKGDWPGGRSAPSSATVPPGALVIPLPHYRRGFDLSSLKSSTGPGHPKSNVAPRLRPTADLVTTQHPARQAEVAHMFEFTAMRKTPWESQCKVFNEWYTITQRAPHGLTYFDNCLRLALCFHVGFGTPRDTKKMLVFLSKSAQGNEIAKALLHRITSSQTDNNETPATALDQALERYTSSQEYLAKRILFSREYCFTTHSGELLGHATRTDPSIALYFACKAGDLSTALDLCVQCDHYTRDPSIPTPLHWLIMFDDNDAVTLGNALIHGTSHRSGPCRDNLNDFPTAGSGLISLPEHCLELGGPPLHWAIRTGNVSLVKLLIELGADVDIRWGNPPRTQADGEGPYYKLSPLDLAVLFHFPEIIQVLLEKGAEFEPSRDHPSALHRIANDCIPLSRQLIHGAQYRNAVKQTISLFINRGFDIDHASPDGATPLLVAIANPDCEAYIIEELISAGADASCVDKSGHNAAIIAAVGCFSRRYNVSSLRLVASKVPDINASPPGSYSALHYAAVAGSIEAVRILAQIPGFDVHRMSENNSTALYHVAFFDSKDVIDALVEAGANIDDVCSSDNYDGKVEEMSALMVAARHRRKMTASYLLQRGAQPDFSFLENPMWPTVLHVACIGAGSADSILRFLLTEHKDILATSALLSKVDRQGRTALHIAAYFGDVEAVEALLEGGADKSVVDNGQQTALSQITSKLNRIKGGKGLGWDHDLLTQKGKRPVAVLEAAYTQIQRLLKK